MGTFEFSSILKGEVKIIEHFIQSIKNRFADKIQVRFEFPAIEIIILAKKTRLLIFKENVVAETTEIAEFCAENTENKSHTAISVANYLVPIDLIVTKEKQLLSVLQSKLQLNKKVFARNCVVIKISGAETKEFLDQYHLMGSTNSAYTIGLFFNDELISVTSFSKGRKMNRLEKHQRSFELIRFCCKDGITVTGGLSKMLAFFVQEKNPGDIMTYIDKQFSEGDSYIKCGFKKHSETPKQQFLINKKTFERTLYSDSSFDKKHFYLAENVGNIKLVYKIEKQ